MNAVTVDPQVVPCAAIGDVHRMQVTAVIENVTCTFIERTAVGDVNWHHKCSVSTRMFVMSVMLDMQLIS